MSTPETASSLKTLTGHKIEGLTRAESFRVDPNLITFEPGFNLREDNEETTAHVDRMVKAMLEGAFIPAVDVMVKDGVIIARDGHCRTRAAIKVRETIPDYTLECRNFRGSDADAVLHMLGTGSGQKPLTPLEQGKGYLRLINMGITAAQIAKRLGVSRPTIDNGLTLAEAPQEVQEMVSSGDVSGTLAREALKAGPAAVEALKGEVVKARAENAASNATPAPAAANGKKPKAAKKKKVTAKNLKGTPAEKKARNEHKIACEKAKNTCRHCSKARGKHFAGVYCKIGEPAMFAPQDVPELVLPVTPAQAAAAPSMPQTPAQAALAGGTISPDEIAILVRRDQAELVVTALRAYFKDDEELQKFASTLETSLL